MVRVPAQLMARARRSGRQPGKSDPIDALAVAHAALREPGLAAAQLDGPAREVKLLSDHRRNLVTERTILANRLRWHLHELDPGLQVPSRGLRRYRVLDELAARLRDFSGVVARIAADLVARCRELTVQVNALERELRGLVEVLAPSLLAIPGCGVLGAATIIGETAGVGRFRSRAAYARFTGTAPVPVWSGDTRIPDPAAAARADAIRRDFTTDAARINTRWCGDITYLATWEGWLYLATVIDIASRRVVGFALADHLRTELVADALANAVAARDPEPGVIFHSDRGCQEYTSAAFADLARDCRVSLSVGRKGQCWDNAVAESFFASLKGELMDLRVWPTRAGACRAVVEYIGWYNGTRLHSTLGYRSPADYENDRDGKLRNVA